MSRETRKMARAAALNNVAVTEDGEEVKLTAQEQLDSMPSLQKLKAHLNQVQSEWDIINEELTIAKARIKRHTTLRVQLFKAELKDSDQ